VLLNVTLNGPKKASLDLFKQDGVPRKVEW
jgi:hypothetical protein